VARRHAERYFKRPPTELVRQRARTAGYQQCVSKGGRYACLVLRQYSIMRKDEFYVSLADGPRKVPTDDRLSD
jgi:hypothetical protein